MGGTLLAVVRESGKREKSKRGRERLVGGSRECIEAVLVFLLLIFS